ncbi:mitochondrial protein Fmp26 [Aulographum hederae CBS 113979]|uniref:Altered inheritance of mitochondria protein 24, mitochondrial n=1 Tax=Aulographum hederae CBS 113979 TaxID=1176131 RepID=A0A6G1GX46_9PEZI|nr:mitochondrial protein Fmp26 [Aulographum hederae CBS 113979]
MRNHSNRALGSFKATSSSSSFSRLSASTSLTSLRPIGRRKLHISATPSSISPVADSYAEGAPAPDARFEVLGAPYSLLSVSLSASQNLYTRRGALVGLSGKPDSVVSNLSVLEPVRRSLLGIPFLYQKISSTTPVTALVSTKSPISTFAVVHLDGRLDWVVAQRNGLLAWTGAALHVRPKMNMKMNLAHWGNSHITGRGLVALVGRGQIYQVQLHPDEEYVAHPSHVLAYTVNPSPPLPYRFSSSNILRFQIPPSLDPSSFFSRIKFFRVMSETPTWRTFMRIVYALRTWSRRTIWGDRLFVQFKGPGTVLLQSRGSRISDILTTRDVNEIADAPAGAVADAVKLDFKEDKGASNPVPAKEYRATTPPTKLVEPMPMSMSFATVKKGERVKFEKE